jgi:hypothetical protein
MEGGDVCTRQPIPLPGARSLTLPQVCCLPRRAPLPPFTPPSDHASFVPTPWLWRLPRRVVLPLHAHPPPLRNMAPSPV